jgi:hypothetical protein
MPPPKGGALPLGDSPLLIFYFFASAQQNTTLIC